MLLRRGAAPWPGVSRPGAGAFVMRTSVAAGGFAKVLAVLPGAAQPARPPGALAPLGRKLGAAPGRRARWGPLQRPAKIVACARRLLVPLGVIRWQSHCFSPEAQLAT